MIPTGLVARVNARVEAQQLAATEQTDNEEGMLQDSQATTTPLIDPTDSPSGQLQQNDTSTDSPRVRSFEASRSNSASDRSADIQPGIRSVAVSSDYAIIFYEIARIQAAFPSFDIDIINAEDQHERAEYLQYIANALDIKPASENMYSASDFLGALDLQEKRLHNLHQIEQKKREHSVLTERLNELQIAYDDKLEREVGQAEVEFHERNKAELKRV